MEIYSCSGLFQPEIRFRQNNNSLGEVGFTDFHL